MPAAPSRLAIAFVLAALTLAGCSTAEDNVRDESGAITESNDNASVFDMKVGDCFNDPESDADVVETLPAVPCSEDHGYEVYAISPIDGDDFPGDEAAEATANQVCADKFGDYIGTEFDDSELDMNYLFPSSESWQGGDHEITCLAIDPENPISGTLEGSKR